MHALIAGFYGESGGGLEIEIGALRTSIVGNQIYGQEDQSQYFRSSSTDNEFGLLVEYSPLNLTVIRRVQFSLLHIGIREFVASSYPAQIVKPDDFVAIATSAQETGVTEELSFINTGKPGFNDPSFFDLFVRERFGHCFCATDRAELGSGVDLPTGFIYDPGNPDIVVFNRGTINKASWVCMLVGAIPACSLRVEILKIVNTPDRITISTNFPVEPTLTGVVNFGNPDIEPNLKFSF